MKRLYKSTKVIYDAHLKEYQVFYKNFIVWHYDSCYRFDEPNCPYPTHYCKREEAEERAIRRASDMLDTVEIWKKTKLFYEP